MISSVRCLRASVPVVLLLAGVLAASHPAHASERAASATALSGNLLVNPRGTDGVAPAQGWDGGNYPVAVAITG